MYEMKKNLKYFMLKKQSDDYIASKESGKLLGGKGECNFFCSIGRDQEDIKTNNIQNHVDNSFLKHSFFKMSNDCYHLDNVKFNPTVKWVDRNIQGRSFIHNYKDKKSYTKINLRFESMTHWKTKGKTDLIEAWLWATQDSVSSTHLLLKSRAIQLRSELGYFFKIRPLFFESIFSDEENIDLELENLKIPGKSIFEDEHILIQMLSTFSNRTVIIYEKENESVGYYFPEDVSYYAPKPRGPIMMVKKYIF